MWRLAEPARPRPVSSTSSATREWCCSAVPSSAASVVACLKYKCAWWFPGEPDAAVHLDGVRRDPGANAAEHVACAILAASAGSSEPFVNAHTA